MMRVLPFSPQKMAIGSAFSLLVRSMLYYISFILLALFSMFVFVIKPFRLFIYMSDFPENLPFCCLVKIRGKNSFYSTVLLDCLYFANHPGKSYSTFVGLGVQFSLTLPPQKCESRPGRIHWQFCS